MSRYATEFYPESRFGGFSDIDGTIIFFSRLNALLSPEAVVVDFGCGRGAWLDDPVPFRRSLRLLKGKAGRVIGLDVDPAAESNPALDEFYLLRGSEWPLPSASADLVLADNVLEHLAEPETFFAEAARTLKLGGHLCIRTPNAWSYVALFSRLLPHRFHGPLLSRVQDRRAGEDVFPVYYRCNTIPRLRRLLARHGFEGAVYGYEAEPSYLSFSRLAYALGVLHQKFAPGFLRLAIFAFARKTGVSK